MFTIDGTTLKLSGTLDYETDESHTVTVRVTDSSGGTYDETFTINVGDVAEGLSDIDVSGNSSVDSSSGPGTVVGTAAAVGLTNSDSASFSLTDDASGRFSIDASTGEISIVGGEAEFTERSNSSNPLDGIDIGKEAFPFR